MQLQNLFGALCAIMFLGCVPEGATLKNVCPAISGVNSITIKVTSSTSLPKDMALSLNSGELEVSENCAGSLGTALFLNESRKTLTAVLSLPPNDSVYFPSLASVPQEEYMDITISQKKNCASKPNPIGFKENVIITWLKASKISQSCDTENFHGTSEFEFNP